MLERVETLIYISENLQRLLVELHLPLIIAGIYLICVGTACLFPKGDSNFEVESFGLLLVEGEEMYQTNNKAIA